MPVCREVWIERALMACEERRPGLTKMYQRLRKKHPERRHDLVLAEAKTAWHARRKEKR